MTSDTPSQAARAEVIADAAQFLIERLNDFESEIGGDAFREWAGHVHPAMARLTMALSASPPAEALPSQTSGAEADTYRVVKVIHGETFSYQPGALVKARDICDGKAVVENLHGMGCIVGVPMDRLALAKPASEPAGGGVREALETYLIPSGRYETSTPWQRAQSRLAVDMIALIDRAALSSPASSSPAEAEALQAGVEALEWESHSCGPDEYLTTARPGPFEGRYEIEAPYEGMKSSFRVRRPGAIQPFAWGKTLDEAKAAAQSDFEQRIRACLATDKEGA